MTPQFILKHDSKEPHCSDASKESREGYIEEMRWTAEYAEPGYTPDGSRGILFANWNHFSKKAGELLERYGYTLEWSDEWDTCEDCNKAVRTSGDCYGWEPYFVLVDDCSVVCLDCLDRAAHLEALEDARGIRRCANRAARTSSQHCEQLWTPVPWLEPRED
jgi:hypothetical protein